MHNSYFVLRELGLRLDEILTGCNLNTCYSQDKDELVMHFTDRNKQYFVQAILHNNFSMIRVADNLKRARKNSVELFTEIDQARVLRVFCMAYERCIGIDLETGLNLLIKMFGNQSNVLLCRKMIPFKIFKRSLTNDLHLSPKDFESNVELSEERLEESGWDLNRVSPVFGGEISRHIEKYGYHNMGPKDKWITIQNVLNQLKNPHYYLYHKNNLPALTLFEPQEYFLDTRDVLIALDEFYKYYTGVKKLNQLRKESLRILQKKRKKAQAAIAKSGQRLAYLEQEVSYREKADIIMANLHLIPTGSSLVHLPDFKTGETVPVKLKASLSPQKNAEQYYRKSKNQQKEVKVLTRNLESARQQLEEVEHHLAFVSNCQDLKQLKNYSREHSIGLTVTSKNTKPLFKEFQYRGFLILVGRNAVNNDLLTLKHAHKDDLWLHAKDVKGSHVVVKQVPGKTYPALVIEKAAQLAAYYSKRKHDTLCPVICTPKKYVRKRKGAPPGEVVVEREKVLLVTPES